MSRRLQWEELDFLECLGVVPEVDEEDYGYSYEVTRGKITLHLIVWDWRNTVSLSLRQEGSPQPLIRFLLLVQGQARRRQEKWGEYLEFLDCVCAPEDGSCRVFSEEEIFDRRQFDRAMNVVVYVQPDICIKFEQQYPL